jgi:O-antigen/teichoic acid export membrane protein
MMVVAASMLPVNLLMNAIRGMFLGKQHIGQFNTSQTWQKFLLVLVFAALYALGKLTAETAVVCMLVTSLIGFIPAQYFFFRNIYTHIEFDMGTLWRMIKKGCIYAGALFLIEAIYKLDVLLLGWMSTKEEVGLYSIAVNVGELLWQLPAAVGVVVFSRSANDRNSPRWQADLARSVRISLWATVAGSLALAIIAPPMFDIMFGKDFGRSVTMTCWLLPGIVVMTVFKLLNMELAGKGKPFVSLFIMLPVVAVNVGLNYLMIPSMGGVGASIASSICYTLAAVIMLVVYCRMYNANFMDFIAFRTDDIKVLTSKISNKFPARREA